MDFLKLTYYNNNDKNGSKMKCTNIDTNIKIISSDKWKFQGVSA